MTREEAKEWVASLKPGDAVLYRFYGDEKIIRVKKVTPSGIVRTNIGMSFKLSYGCTVIGYGGKLGGIYPLSDDAVKRIEDRETIKKAIIVARSLQNSIPLNFAREFLDLCERYGIDG